ncbi:MULTISPECIES: GPW/gp25 family protein [unclassified Agarivorans]|uniref:GPW/gp25 family protein n=1 Tax=unclassified Agarivorans TaxID=2636026 RepID=UPI0026E1D6E8|nr:MULTISPECIES: GPW/gp25 family protein [unclassified Agarivorans]MDO6686771.1 GPW/gp25 family protein [Agarivorans sp. 3_MG-2023]MDO6716499.1 GPW/gp25 family protein [Agarivorans sp. 2_MG-2023]
MANSDTNFLGQGWSFPPSFALRNGAAQLVVSDEDISQSLHILLSTKPGERLMHPNFGCALHQFVFRNLSVTTVSAIQDMVKRAVLHFEPRIILERVDVGIDDYYQGKIDIVLSYIISQTNTRTNLVYPFYFKEATDVSASGG